MKPNPLHDQFVHVCLARSLKNMQNRESGCRVDHEQIPASRQRAGLCKVTLAYDDEPIPPPGLGDCGTAEAKGKQKRERLE